MHWRISWNRFKLLIFIEKCKVAIVYELLGQPMYIESSLIELESSLIELKSSVIV